MPSNVSPKRLISCNSKHLHGKAHRTSDREMIESCRCICGLRILKSWKLDGQHENVSKAWNAESVFFITINIMREYGQCRSMKKERNTVSEEGHGTDRSMKDLTHPNGDQRKHDVWIFLQKLQSGTLCRHHLRWKINEGNLWVCLKRLWQNALN